MLHEYPKLAQTTPGIAKSTTSCLLNFHLPLDRVAEARKDCANASNHLAHQISAKGIVWYLKLSSNL